MLSPPASFSLSLVEPEPCSGVIIDDDVPDGESPLPETAGPSLDFSLGSSSTLPGITEGPSLGPSSDFSLGSSSPLPGTTEGPSLGPSSDFSLGSSSPLPGVTTGTSVGTSLGSSSPVPGVTTGTSVGATGKIVGSTVGPSLGSSSPVPGVTTGTSVGTSGNIEGSTGESVFFDSPPLSVLLTGTPLIEIISSYRILGLGPFLIEKCNVLSRPYVFGTSANSSGVNSWISYWLPSTLVTVTVIFLIKLIKLGFKEYWLT